MINDPEDSTLTTEREREREREREKKERDGAKGLTRFFYCCYMAAPVSL